LASCGVRKRHSLVQLDLSWRDLRAWRCSSLTSIRGDYFRFGSVFIKKSNQTKIFFFWKKNRNRTETGSNWPVSVRFGSVFLGQKPVQTGLARFSRFWLGFFRFWLCFFWFGLVFSVWLGFGSVWLGFFGFLSVSVRFSFFGFLVIKPKPNRTGRFFQKFNRIDRFFFSVRFFQLFFFRFSRFNRFSGFFAHP